MLVSLDRKVVVLLAAAGALSAAAIGVRAIPAPRVVDPKDVVEEGPRIAEPMQLLGRGAAARAPELDAWVAAERRPRFKATREILFRLEGCPDTAAWLDSVEGQRCERLVGELRTGTREEALAGLTLLLRLARATDWEPGMLDRQSGSDAERLAGLFSDWLRAWGERGARDPLLSDPARVAVLVYGLLMHTAQEAPVIGTNAAATERGVRVLEELLGLDGGRRTALGEALQARNPAALRKLAGDGDRLRGVADEARTVFPDLTGDCAR